jgi:hypothetical protein
VAPPKAPKAAADVSANGPQGIAANSDRAVSNAKSEPVQTLNESRRRWLARRRLGLDTLAVLSEWFPLAFKPPVFRPLKLRIHLDLIERAPVTAEEVHAALSIHCHALSYLRAQVAGAPRIDLDGNPAGVVSAEEAASARGGLAGYLQRLKARKAAKTGAPKPTEARQRPSAGEGVPVAPKALTHVLGQRGRPVISLGGGWKGGAS